MKRRAALALGGSFTLAGCGLSERPYLRRRQWPLIVNRPVVLPPRPRGRVLLVRAIAAGPGLEARGLQSVQPDGSIKTDFYDEWAVPPAEAVEDNLRQWLAASGLFAAVLAPGSRLPADLVLEGDLTAFWADIPAMRARASLALVLLGQNPNPIRVLMQRDFSADPPLNATAAPEIATGLRTALAQVFGRVEQALGGQAAV